MSGINRSEFLARAGTAAGALAFGKLPEAAHAAAPPSGGGFEIAAYYFPQFHPDPRNDGWHGRGWSEWEIVKRAEPRFDSHRQPNLPTWGFEDDALTDLATPYSKLRERVPGTWKRLDGELPVPYFPNVSMGWDPSPRCNQSDVYENLGYPFTPVLVDNSPREFRRALEAQREFLTGRDGPRIGVVNAWNEWPEGSFLEPGKRYGTAYLDALKGIYA